MKTDGCLSCSPLKGSFGDTLFAVFCSCVHDISKILAHLQALFTWIICIFMGALPGAGPDHQTIKAI